MNNFKILTEEQQEQIHQTALRLLAEVGVKFHNQEALEVLEKAGAKVEGNLVKIPDSLVKESLEITPSEFTLYNRDLTNSFKWGVNSDIHLGGAGSAIILLDSDGKTYRKPKTEDLINLFKIIDALPEISWMEPGMIVKDVPPEIVGVWRFYLRLKYGSKPSRIDGISEEDLIDNISLLRVVRENEEDFFKKPFSICGACPTPPLNWTNEGSAFLVKGARAKLPISFTPMIFTGVGAPATVAASVAQHVAEALAGLVLVEQITPGIPVVYSGAPVYMDMRYGSVCVSPIEALMVTMAHTQMAHYYNIPSGTGDITGHSDSKLIDFQCGAESALSQVLFALSGNKGPGGVGFLASQEGYSLEKLVMDCEVFRYTKKLINGISVSPETLAFEVMKEVVPEGDFLTHEHTLKWFRREYEFSELFDRQSRVRWQESGGKEIFERAREKVNEIVTNTQLNRLSPEVDKVLDEKMDSVLKRRGMKLEELKTLLPHN
jgi:trimethylamine--corrinoid protein Co-methyltransferase